MATMSSKTRMSGSDRANKERAELKSSNLLGTSNLKYVRKPLRHAPSAEVEVAEYEDGQMVVDLTPLIHYTKPDGTEGIAAPTIHLTIDPATGDMVGMEDWGG